MKHIVAEKLVKVATKKLDEKDSESYSLRKDVEHVLEEKDIAYSTDFDMDRYFPQETFPQDLYILDIHGGAWVYGKKELNRHFCMHLAKGGFTVFNMNYGLAPEHTVKQQIQQIFTALQYIKNKEGQFGLKNAHVCLCGDSAGAHLASLAACIIRDKKLADVYEVNIEGIKVEALLLQHGVYDLTLFKASKIRLFRILYGWLFPDNNKSLTRVDCLSAILDENWDIPMYLLSSKQDKMFSPQTIALVDQLKQLHVPHEALIWDESYDTLQHVFHILKPDAPESKESIEAMIHFLHKVHTANNDKIV